MKADMAKPQKNGVFCVFYLGSGHCSHKREKKLLNLM